MIYSDLHCHPLLKCYGKNEHSPTLDVKNEANLFHHNRFNLWDKVLENVLKLTPYRQSDLYSAYKGQSLLLGSSMYSPERDFFVGDFDFPGVENWITDFGKEWIKEIQNKNTSYFDGLKQQFEFIESLDGQKTLIKGKAFQYQIIKSKLDLKTISENPNNRSIALFYNIEGGHNLFHHLETQKESDQKIAEGSIAYIKSKAPFYFTFAHHFYNQLSGHCLSLPPSLQKLRHQKYGSNLGLRPQGEEVIKALLSRSNGPRILIDIKHMNPLARNRYFEMLDEMTEQGDRVPVLFSHGGANGMKSFNQNAINNPLLHSQEIGLYDDEIVKLVRSEGLFGLNMDERVMSSDEALKETKRCKRTKKRFNATSGLIWNNIEQIVTVTAREGLNPWYNICIGSDFDGIINPVNGFWTLEYLPRFRKYLAKHLKKYLSSNPDMAYGMNQDEILDGIFYNNMKRFMLKNYDN